MGWKRPRSSTSGKDLSPLDHRRCNIVSQSVHAHVPPSVSQSVCAHVPPSVSPSLPPSVRPSVSQSVQSCFSLGTPVFPFPQKPTFLNFNSIPVCTGISERVLVNSLVVNKLHIHYFTFIFYLFLLWLSEMVLLFCLKTQNIALQIPGQARNQNGSSQTSGYHLRTRPPGLSRYKIVPAK